MIDLFKTFIVLFPPSLIEAHANLDDDVAESEAVSRFGETMLTLDKGELSCGKELRDIRHVIHEQEKRDIEMVHKEIGK